MAGLGGIRPCRFKFTGPRPPPFQLITLDFQQNRRSPMYLMSFMSFPRGVWGMSPRGWGTSTSGCRHHGLLLRTDRKVCNKNVNYVYCSSCAASEIIDVITQAVQFHVFDTPPISISISCGVSLYLVLGSFSCGSLALDVQLWN